METEEFWALLDESREAADGDTGRQTELLTAALARRTPQDIVSFDALFHTTRARGYSWDLWAVGYLAAGGGMSDDAFGDFRAYLIGRGKEVWDRAVEDPDSLTDALGDDPDEAIGESEGLAYAAAKAYEQSTGSEMPAPTGTDDEDGDTEDDATGEPSGLPWDENEPKDLAKRFPNAWAKWGEDDAGS